MKLHIESLVCNPFQESTYLVWDEASRRCLVIDPGMCCDAEWLRLRRLIEQHQLTPQYILITHGHTDHVMGTAYLTRQYPGLQVLGPVEDQNHLPTLQEQNMLFGVDVDIHWSPITRNLSDGDVITFAADGTAAADAADGTASADAQCLIRVIDVPGHSFHGLCYYFEQQGILFSGDVLFCGSVGRSFGPDLGGDPRGLVEGIVRHLLTLPADVKVYPGHGPATTIGYESSYNPYLY